MLDLVETLGALLRRKNMKLVTAESCTGGLLGTTITHKAGASDIFERGFITYSNESKMELLGVSPQTLETHGAVSSQTAEEMATGALERSHADLAVSVTGIAGPDGGTPQKPVGLVFFGYVLKGGSVGSLEYLFEGDRNTIQTEATIVALRHLIIVLERPT